MAERVTATRGAVSMPKVEKVDPLDDLSKLEREAWRDTVMCGAYESLTVFRPVREELTRLRQEVVTLRHERDAVIALAIRDKQREVSPRFAVDLPGTWGEHGCGFTTREEAEKTILTKACSTPAPEPMAQDDEPTTGAKCIDCGRFTGDTWPICGRCGRK